MRLSDPIDKPGFFWLPGSPDLQYPGSLHISESGEISLRIVHRPTAADLHLLHGNTPIGEQPPRIMGIVDNRQVTLQECVAVDDPFYFLRIVEGHVSVSRFRVAVAFIGAPFLGDEPISFSKIILSFESLSEWFSISGFRSEIDSNSEKAHWSLHYTQPDDISMYLPDGVRLEFEFSPTFSFPDYKVSQLSSNISQQIHVSLATDRALKIECFFHIMRKIQTFLCLVMNRATSIEWIRGYSKDKLDKHNREIETNIFFHSQLQVPPRDAHGPMIYKYRDISDVFEETFLRWLETFDVIQPAFDLYLSSKIGAHKYLNGVFLSLIQSLETFHRRTSNETEMERGDFDQLRATVIRSIPPERRNHIESRLEYANEISLNKRLKRLIKPFRYLFGSSTEVKSLVRDIVEVRNYLTHYDKKVESRAKKVIERDLYDICLKLDVLIQLCFLQFAGMDADRVKSLAENSRVVRHRLGLNDSDE